jgi:[FeFe] hydrogenase H-cluster maturation GTPase HydF
MTSAPRGMRLHIGIFGRRNAGKSTILNLMAGQEVSIVSPAAGTTADPVEKPMEFIPLGPVLWIDTAGLDDVGGLGEKRAAAARRVFERTDLAVLVFSDAWDAFEQGLYDEFTRRNVPVVLVHNQSDLHSGPPSGLPDGANPVDMAARDGVGKEALRREILLKAPADFIEAPPLVRDLLTPGDLVVMVTPIDAEAPKGRMILPQVQTLRDILDGDCRALVTREDGLRDALAGLSRPPGLVVTDSQAFKAVAEAVPPEIPMTGFSVLYARARGDLAAFAEGAADIARLRDGDRILVAESCTHHSVEDDIGRVKLPALIGKKTGRELTFEMSVGHDFPENLAEYALVLHCGACMTNRRAVLSRVMAARAAGVAIVNYGIAIAYCLDLLDRALGPFPDARQAFERARSRSS